MPPEKNHVASQNLFLLFSILIDNIIIIAIDLVLKKVFMKMLIRYLIFEPCGKEKSQFICKVLCLWSIFITFMNKRSVFSENYCFLPPYMHTFKFVSGGKIGWFYRKFYVCTKWMISIRNIDRKNLVFRQSKPASTQMIFLISFICMKTCKIVLKFYFR